MTNSDSRLAKNTDFTIAYFSAEIGISSQLPTYSGGLGVLAGDHIKSSADAGLNMCAVTLLYKEGYFKQRIDEEGNQSETFPRFDPYPMLKKLPVMFTLKLRNRDVWIQAFEYRFKGITGHEIPIYFLDTDVADNFHDDRVITLRLYSGDKDHRILQEAILGFGGIQLLEKLGINGSIETYHMNEGHCSFLTLGLLDKFNNNEEIVRQHCHFTTHTPVEAGHDHFAKKRCDKLLHNLLPDNLNLPSLVQNSRWHMTELGLYFSRSANGVSKLHGGVAQEQFPEFNIGAITNGVYHPYWVGKEFRELYTKYFPDWKENPQQLLNIDEIPDKELLYMHQSHKHFLLGYANSQTGKALSEDVLTLGFARRAAEYKRARLIFHDLERLIEISEGKLQIVFAGKAHPNDRGGKQIIQNIVEDANRLFGKVKVVFLENYNMWLGKLITSGVDVWVNTPLRPNEASGTSGMKAALNGIPNLSILDGWWAEACRHGENGWAIGNPDKADDERDAASLYNTLEKEVIPAYYSDHDIWLNLMRESIKTSVQYTAHRMIQDYNERYYSKK
ncbi:MAG: alpha-glucan family phosphorylase [Candidatus Marinimicrobia bacterium]|nr:alpha-glucan family phosphorylase [Candidatus Neomarinimicrobiota bacterium]